MGKKKKYLGSVTQTKDNIFQKYNKREAKKDALNTLMKTGVDVIGASVVGGTLGALTGKHAVWFGLAMIGTGHFFGDKTGILRVAGAGAVAYGVAKYNENTAVNGLGAQPTDAKTRLNAFKHELLSSFYLDKIFKKKDTVTSSTTTADADGTTVGSIDLSSLDFFEDFNQQEADEYHEKLALENNGVAGTFDDEEFAYSIIDNDPDFTRM